LSFTIKLITLLLRVGDKSQLVKISLRFDLIIELFDQLVELITLLIKM